MKTMTAVWWVAKALVVTVATGCAVGAPVGADESELVASVEYRFDGFWRGPGRGEANLDGWIQQSLLLKCGDGSEILLETDRLPRGSYGLEYEWHLGDECVDPVAYVQHTWFVTAGQAPFLAPYTERAPSRPVSAVRLNIVGIDWHDEDAGAELIGFLTEHFVWELYGPPLSN